jgi:hypothetical protein
MLIFRPTFRGSDFAGYYEKEFFLQPTLIPSLSDRDDKKPIFGFYREKWEKVCALKG